MDCHHQRRSSCKRRTTRGGDVQTPRKRTPTRLTQLEKEIKKAQDELLEAAAHGEAQVQSVLKKKADDEKGWKRRLAEAECRLGEAERQKATTTVELKKKLDVLGQVCGVLRLARRQSNCQQEQIRKSKSSLASKHIQCMHAKRSCAYKVELRALARVLVTCGCKEGQVGNLMQDIAKIFGIDLDRAMSHRTVRRAVLEGLVASQVQLGIEIKYTEGIPPKIFNTPWANKMNRHYDEQRQHVASQDELSVPPHSSVRPCQECGRLAELIRAAQGSLHGSRINR
jgi:hypothetical protein